MTNSYGFCVYHEIECDYEGLCIECPHNTEEDTKWFKEDELKELEHDKKEIINTKSVFNLSEDLISRQDAIDAFDGVKVDEKTEYDIGYNDGIDLAVSKLSVLPSAQPERKTDGDTISRQAAIDALDKRFDSIPMEQTTEILLLRKDLRELPSAQPFTAEQIQTMQELEAAQVEKAYELGKADRPTGHWIENAQEYYEMINEKGGGVDENTPYFTDDIACSECLAKFSVIDNETERFDYCPNCGAYMRGEEE